MRVRIRQDLCQGHAMCLLACPSMFELEGDAGHGVVLAEEVPERFEFDVRQAQQSCPEQAIEIY